MAIHVVCWGVKRKAQIPIVWPGSCRPCVALRMISWMSVRHSRSGDGDAYTLRLAEHRRKNKRRQNCALHKNGNGQGSAPYSAFSPALFRIAFDEAPA